jgi:hypothetical protein
LSAGLHPPLPQLNGARRATSDDREDNQERATLCSNANWR